MPLASLLKAEQKQLTLSTEKLAKKLRISFVTPELNAGVFAAASLTYVGRTH